MVTTAAVVGELRNVSVAYHGDINVLQDLSLQFRAGAVTGIIGPNGAGKSTVLRTLFGLLKPREGEVLINGRSTASVQPHQMTELGVGFVPQGRSLFLDLSIEDNLTLGCWSFRRKRAEVRRALENAYGSFPDLYADRFRMAGSLSGGQRRFLEIARAMLAGPSMLLLDEPTAMIAPKMAGEIYGKAKELSQNGLAIVLVDQNVKQCVGVSDYLYVMQLGRKTAESNGRDLANDHSIRSIIGSWLEVQGG